MSADDELAARRAARMAGHPSTGEQLPYAGAVCQCGSPWWLAKVAIGADGNVTGYDIAVCAECGEGLPARH